MFNFWFNRSIFFVALLIFLQAQVASARSIQSLSCKNIFHTTLHTNAREQILTQQALTDSEQLASLDPTFFNITKRFIRWHQRQVYKQIVSFYNLPPSHPGALFLNPFFYPEFFWPTTVSLRTGAFQSRTPFLSQAERENMHFEWTSRGIIHSAMGELITSPISGDFVIGLDRQIYIVTESTTPNSFFRHSSFFAGGPVLFAGVIQIEPSGLISYLSRGSGHYQPSREHFEWTIDFLRAQGFKMRGTYPDSYR